MKLNQPVEPRRETRLAHPDVRQKYIMKHAIRLGLLASLISLVWILFQNYIYWVSNREFWTPDHLTLLSCAIWAGRLAASFLIGFLSYYIVLTVKDIWREN